ncbi:MAG: hypothetical protein RI826_03145 [Chlorobium phaeovibrioides]|nr:hypothetical protein [Chlorobium phaeovibrioides]
MRTVSGIEGDAGAIRLGVLTKAKHGADEKERTPHKRVMASTAMVRRPSMSGRYFRGMMNGGLGASPR